jgi:hypothetical protein
VLDLNVYLLARDEPGRNWDRRRLPYRYTRVPALQIPGKSRPWYVPLPTWLFRRGHILVAGFGLAALVTAAIRPRSTLIWSEATRVTERCRGRVRTRFRRWMVGRSRAVVAVGQASTEYLRDLGAIDILLLPNVLDPVPNAPIPALRTDSAPSPLVLTHVGDWSVAKGAVAETDVFRLLTEQCRSSGKRVEFFIAGNILDAPVPADATYLGYLPYQHIWDILKRHSVTFLLLLSKSDTWGFVIAEAIEAGIIPLASPNVGSAIELLTPVAPLLVSAHAEDVANTIYRLHGDESRMSSTLSALSEVASSRTSDWAAKCFYRGLTEL